MKKLFTTIIAILLVVFAFSQSADNWYYLEDKDISFPEGDTLANPYKCTVDSAGNLWVISSVATDTNAINGLYKASPGDSVFTLVDDYSDDPDVNKTTGITNIENNVFVLSQKVGIPVVSFVYYYPEGDPAQRELINDEKANGYGTKVNGFEATKDGYIFGGIIYQGPKMRGYDYTEGADPWGQYISAECQSVDPGGSYILGDAIRDIGIIPNGDYSDPNTPLYTSRNSALSGEKTGGVTKWTGGVQDSLTGYTGESVDDVGGFLKWTSKVPNGITCDSNGRLWAVGTDSSRKWVKAFQVDGNWATQVNELPSSTSQDISYPDGAPLSVPEDVALSPNETMAYVIDQGAKKAFVFSTSETAVKPSENEQFAENFILYSAYPNPFNPITNISFNLPGHSNVKITLYNLKGQFVKDITNQRMNRGKHTLQADFTGLSSGIYFYKISTKFGSRTEKITFLE